jgi:cellulose synthase/poly-beta-1,6-N-acetylglucosamine synthase-like glycosyltransferase
MKNLVLTTITWHNNFVIIYFLILNFSYLILLLLAADRLFYYKKKKNFLYCNDKDQASIPSVSILVPSHNEELTILDSVSAILKIDYPQLEIIVINDGSTDNTLNKLKESYKLFKVNLFIEEHIKTKPIKNVYRSAVDSRLIVVDKENGGKADSLNVGLNISKSRLFCSIDADSLIEKDAIYKIVQPYLERDAKVVGIGGIVRVINGCEVRNSEVVKVNLPKKFLPAIQVMEYIRAFLCGRTGWSKINSLIIISGAFGLFDRKTVIECGGYSTDTVGEDMELVVRLHRYMCDRDKEYKMTFIPEPVCWTQVPEKLKILSQQRKRWQRGLIETMWRHKKMIFNLKYRTSGMVAMPFFLFFEMFSPIIELSGYIVTAICFYFGWVNKEFVILFLYLSIIFGIILSLFSLLLEEYTAKRYVRPKDVINLFLFAIIENLGYRQINSWWRLKSFFDIFSSKNSWGEMQRKALHSLLLLI